MNFRNNLDKSSIYDKIFLDKLCGQTAFIYYEIGSQVVIWYF